MRMRASTYTARMCAATGMQHAASGTRGRTHLDGVLGHGPLLETLDEREHLQHSGVQLRQLCLAAQPVRASPRGRGLCRSWHRPWGTAVCLVLLARHPAAAAAAWLVAG
jgi:hypothetical protein